MSDAVMPPNLAAEIRRLKSQIEALQMAGRATRTSVQEGVFEVQDDAGTSVVELGKIGSSYGIRIKTPEGRTVFQVRDDGGFTPSNRFPVYQTQNALTPNTAFSGQGNHAAWSDITAFMDAMWYGEFNAVGSNVSGSPYFWLPAAHSLAWDVVVVEAGATLSVLASGTTSTTGSVFFNDTIPTAALNGGTDPRGRELQMQLRIRRTAGTGRVGVGWTTGPKNF